MTHEEQLAVCERFDLGEPKSCQPLGGTRNRNSRLTTSRGQFVVRDRYVGYRDPSRIAFDHAAVQFLSSQGAPVVSPIPALDQKSYWQDGEHLWEVFPAMQGEHFRDGNVDDVRALAVALAQFHQAGTQIKSGCNKMGPRGETDPQQMLLLIRSLRPDANDAVRRYENAITSAASTLTDAVFSSLPQTLIHGDIQPANILVHDGKVSALVDLDWCDRRPRIYDIAFAILLCCATHTSPIDGGDIWSLSQEPHVQASLVELFLQTYNEQGWPFEPNEIAVLGPQIILSWCHCRLAGAMKVEPGRRDEFLSRPPQNLATLCPDPILCENPRQ